MPALQTALRLQAMQLSLGEGEEVRGGGRG